MNLTIDPMAGFKKVCLPNGLTLYTKFDNLPFIIINIMVHSGHADDPIGKDGVAHLVEHAINENIPGKTADELRYYYEDIGGSFMQGATGPISTEYSIKVPRDNNLHLEAFQLLSKMLLNSKFKKRINEEKKIVVAEMNGRLKPKALDMADRRAYEMVFDSHAYARMPLFGGRKESLRKITVEDLENFYCSHYLPANMSLIVYGGCDQDEILRILAGTSFTDSSDGKRVSRKQILPPHIHEYSSFSISQAKAYSGRRDMTEFSSLAALGPQKNWMASMVFQHLLQDLLFLEVRQKRQWSYSGFEVGFMQDRQGSTFEIHGDVLTGKGKDIDLIIDECIERVTASSDNLEQVKLRAMRQNRYIELTPSHICHISLQTLGSYNAIPTLEETAKDIAAVSMNDMESIARLVTSNHRVSIIII